MLPQPQGPSFAPNVSPRAEEPSTFESAQAVVEGLAIQMQMMQGQMPDGHFGKQSQFNAQAPAFVPQTPAQFVQYTQTWSVTTHTEPTPTDTTSERASERASEQPSEVRPESEKPAREHPALNGAQDGTTS